MNLLLVRSQPYCNLSSLDALTVGEISTLLQSVLTGCTYCWWDLNPTAICPHWTHLLLVRSQPYCNLSWLDALTVDEISTLLQSVLTGRTYCWWDLNPTCNLSWLDALTVDEISTLLQSVLTGRTYCWWDLNPTAICPHWTHLLLVRSQPYCNLSWLDALTVDEISTLLQSVLTRCTYCWWDLNPTAICPHWTHLLLVRSQPYCNLSSLDALTVGEISTLLQSVLTRCTYCWWDLNPTAICPHWTHLLLVRSQPYCNLSSLDALTVGEISTLLQSVLTGHTYCWWDLNPTAICPHWTHLLLVRSQPYCNLSSLDTLTVGEISTLLQSVLTGRTYCWWDLNPTAICPD